MDPDDPISLLFTKIRPLEPEHASKIIGYLLLQDMGKHDLMRLALGPETLLQSVCLKAKSHLGISSTTMSTRTPLNLLSPSITSASLNSNPNLNLGLSQTGSSSVAGGVDHASGSGDFLDEQQLDDYLSFLEDSSSKDDEVVNPYGFSANNGDVHMHRRSFSASDAPFRGYGDNFDGSRCFESPGKIGYVYRQQEEMMRMKMAHRQQMAASQFMATEASPMPYGKSLNFYPHPQNANRPMQGQFGEEGGWYGSPRRYEREDVMIDKFYSASRQIYLTFPPESSFTDDDVSNYFSNYGAVQDVRIPYQQKRMFGFVTFVHADTVRRILGRGNPHFICDSRVLVKPYKEKGRIIEHSRRQQMERGHLSPCSSPSGPRMFSGTQEMLRREAEQSDLQNAIELQSRRFVNLKLPDLENESIHHRHHLHHQGNSEARGEQLQIEANRGSQNKSEQSWSQDCGYNGKSSDVNKGDKQQPEGDEEKGSLIERRD